MRDEKYKTEERIIEISNLIDCYAEERIVLLGIEDTVKRLAEYVGITIEQAIKIEYMECSRGNRNAWDYCARLNSTLRRYMFVKCMEADDAETTS